MSFGTLHRGRALADLTLAPTPMLVAPWLAAGSTTLLFGPPSAGKTHLTLSIADALLRGAPLWSAYPTVASRVLVVQADMNTVLYQERLRPNAHRLTDNFAALTTDAMPFDVCKLTPKDATVAAVRNFAPHLIIVDTLRKSHAFDENDSNAPDRVYGAWRALFPGAAFLFLHHSRKISTHPDASKMISEAFRGSGAWAASADTIIMQRRVRRQNNPYWMTRIQFVRTRSCAEPAPMLLKLNESLMLEPFVGSPLEEQLLGWITLNPRARRADAVKWLLEQVNPETGKALCSQSTAYRAWDHVVRGEDGIVRTNG